MTDRAFKFLADNTKKFQYVKGKLYIMTDTVPDLLERFHAQCLPTNREIYSKFGKANNTIVDIDNTLLIRGATWCRDFVREEPKKEKLICCGCGQDISGNAIFENHLSFHNESCIRMLKYMGEFMFGKPKAVDYKVSPTEKKEPTLEDEINALKEPTVENATTHDLLTELIKRNLK